MITFDYKIVIGPKTGKKYIEWDCSWDGSHNEEWYSVAEADDVQAHPFFHTSEFKRELEYHDRLMARFKKHKQSAIYPSKPQKPNKRRDAKQATESPGTSYWYNWPMQKITKAEIEDMHPKHMREIGNIVAYNAATEGLCKVIKYRHAMDTYSGNTDNFVYFQNLLEALDLLWD